MQKNYAFLEITNGTDNHLMPYTHARVHMHTNKCINKDIKMHQSKYGLDFRRNNEFLLFFIESDWQLLLVISSETTGAVED